jgi:hypothetical protein
MDGHVELIDAKTNKMFLKKCLPAEDITLKDLYVGNTVTVFSRKLRIDAFANPFTERALGTARS